MKLRILGILILLVSSLAYSQEPTLLWISRGTETQINSFCFSNDSSRAYLQMLNRTGGSTVYSIRIINPRTGGMLGEIPVRIAFEKMDVSPDEHYLIGANSASNLIEVVDLREKKSLRFDMAEATNFMFPSIVDLSFLRNGREYAVQELSYKKLQRFDAETGEKSFVECGGDAMKWIYFSNYKNYFGVVRADTSISVYGMTSMNEFLNIKLKHIPHHISFSPDGKYILTGFDLTEEVNNIKMFGVMGNLVDEWQSDFRYPYPHFTSDSRHFLTSTFPRGGLELRSIDGPDSAKWIGGTFEFKAFDCSVQDTAFGVYNRELKHFEYRSIIDGGLIYSYPAGDPNELSSSTNIKILPKGELVYIAGSNGLIKIRGLKDGREKGSVRTDSTEIKSIAVSPDGSRLATCAESDTLKLWNIEGSKSMSPELIKTVSTGVQFSALAFTPDGRHIVAGGKFTGIYYFDSYDLAYQRYDSSGYRILSLAFSPDGKKLAYGTSERDLVILSVNDDNTLLRDAAFQADFSPSDWWGGIYSVNYSNDGRKIVTTAGDWSSHVWDAVNYVEITSLKPGDTEAHSSLIRSALFTRDDSKVIIGDDGGFIKIYDLASSATIWHNDTIFKPDKVASISISDMSISKDGQYLAVTARDGSALVYDLGPLTGVVDELPVNAITPNPASDYIEISSPSIKRGPGGESEEIKIYNTFCECVFTLGAEQAMPLQKIDVSGLAPGVYFVRMGDRVCKFVKI